MIQIIDKVNDSITKIQDNTEVIIDPKGNTLFIDDFQHEGKVIYGIIHKEDGTTLFCYTGEKKKKARDCYDYIKHYLKTNGYKHEIEWCENIPSEIDKKFFFREYAWVVINSGMKNKIAEKIYLNFWNNGDINFEAIKHSHKNKAITHVYNRLDHYFRHFKQSKNKLVYLKSLPFIGNITKFHLARNLGLDYAKPDRHLVRIANLFEYDNVQTFCKDISELCFDKIGVVDLVFWRFATLFKDYLDLLKKWC